MGWLRRIMSRFDRRPKVEVDLSHLEEQRLQVERELAEIDQFDAAVLARLREYRGELRSLERRRQAQ